MSDHHENLTKKKMKLKLTIAHNLGKFKVQDSFYYNLKVAHIILCWNNDGGLKKKLQCVAVGDSNNS